MSLEWAAMFAALVFNAAPLYDVKEMCQMRQSSSFVPLPWIALFSNAFLWFLYGILIRQLIPMVACNVVGVIASCVAIATFLKLTNDAESVKKATRLIRYVSIFVGCLVLSCGTNLWIAMFTDRDVSSNTINALGTLGVCVNVCMFSSPLAEFAKVLRTRNTKTISPSFTSASFLCATLWFALGLRMDDPYVWVSNGIGVLVSTMQLGLFVCFGCPSREASTKHPYDLVELTLPA